SRFAVVGGKNWPLFMIPDGYGQWKETSPSRHNAYITEADKRSGGKLKYTSQLLKHWRYSRVTPVPVSSFHIELLMAHGGHCIGMKGYAECVRDVFRDLTARGCRGLQDPVGISGVIACSRTEAQRHAALVSATYSRDHATSACIAQLYGIPEAVRQWKLVFNQGFPT
ncbi:MAG TPA: hypothetical protein PL070_13610, partial [Flavobacteriales bacterium]|nr:hypothetical protein [Flavobacteriales bacterium]